ncbi:glycosyltransferase family 2 protein [candidate division KSB1 bacterium]
MNTLSVSIIGHNEAHCLNRCFNSVKDADEIVYVDCESSDNSVEVARHYTSNIYTKENNPNLNVNKSFGFSKATKDWILYIDPDEIIPRELFDEIKHLLISDPGYDGYYIPRKNHYFGKWLRWGAQYPDYQLRLFRKGKGAFENLHVHEKIKIESKVGHLRNPMLHYPYETVSQFIRKFDFYTTFEANYLAQNSVNISLTSTVKRIIFRPFLRFFKRYFIKLGFLDGFPGLFAAFGDAAVSVTSYVKLWELHKSKSGNKDKTGSENR